MNDKKEYIERGAALLAITGQPSELHYPSWYKGNIMEVPAADVAPVVHGEWIVKTVYKTPLSHGYIRKEKLHICPYCAKEYRQKMNFCGNCGAKMDGGKEK